MGWFKRVPASDGLYDLSGVRFRDVTKFPRW